MLKDIPRIAVEDIAIAIIPKEVYGENNESLWEVYILNLKREKIENVLVSSKGYGTYKGETVKTSTLRHFLGEVEALMFLLSRLCTYHTLCLTLKHFQFFFFLN